MIDYDKFSELKQFTDNIGQVYGTEDFAVYLYSIAKMTRPNLVVELGTGFGTTALWIGQALKENNYGQIITIDDGSEWLEIGEQVKDRFKSHFNLEYKDCINGLIKYFDLQNQIKFFNEKIARLNTPTLIDILFSDFAHGSFDICKLIADYLTNMSENSRIYIDSASTNFSSFHTLEAIVKIFNSGRVPHTILELVAITDKEKFIDRVRNTRFDLEHIIENKQRAQNSTACIRLSPIDIMPQPRIGIRF